MLELLLVYLPAVLALLGSIAVLALLNWLLLGRNVTVSTHSRLPRQLILFGLTLAAILLVIILFPMSDSTRGQIITLLGIVTTGVIALSSTSFVANVMAGLMLQTVKSFSPGDFVRVGKQFGRVTERGLFHIEIQTEDRDLTTIPNLHLATNPVTVVHSTGTIISAELSLGYDVSHVLVEDLLKQAAVKVGLQDPFVLILALNDFSISYRVSGFLSEIKNLITLKSNLKKAVLDELHENDVEIVSPNFMNQRQLTADKKIIPDVVPSHIVNKKSSSEPESTAEDIIFDKAEVAAESEVMRSTVELLSEKVSELTKSKKGIKSAEKELIDVEIKSLEEDREKLLAELENADAKDKVEKD